MADGQKTLEEKLAELRQQQFLEYAARRPHTTMLSRGMRQDLDANYGWPNPEATPEMSGKAMAPLSTKEAVQYFLWNLLGPNFLQPNDGQPLGGPPQYAPEPAGPPPPTLGALIRGTNKQ